MSSSSIVILILVGLYLVTSVAPWVALTLLNRSLRRRVARVSEIEARAQELDRARAEARTSFPEAPRPGAYAELDRQAHNLLNQLTSEASLLDAQRTDLLFFSPTHPGVLRGLFWGSWPALLETLRVRGCLARIESLLSDTERMLFQLGEIQRQISNLCRVPREHLQAGIEAITTLGQEIEADRARGVLGIAVQPAEIQSVRTDLQSALERIDHDQEMGLQVPQIARQADAALAKANKAMERMQAARAGAHLHHEAGQAQLTLRDALQAARRRAQALTEEEGQEEQLAELEQARRQVDDLLAQLESASMATLGATVAEAHALIASLAKVGYARAVPQPEPEPEEEPEEIEELEELEGSAYAPEEPEPEEEEEEALEAAELPVGGWVPVSPAEASRGPVITMPVAAAAKPELEAEPELYVAPEQVEALEAMEAYGPGGTQSPEPSYQAQAAEAEPEKQALQVAQPAEGGAEAPEQMLARAYVQVDEPEEQPAAEAEPALQPAGALAAEEAPAPFEVEALAVESEPSEMAGVGLATAPAAELSVKKARRKRRSLLGRRGRSAQRAEPQAGVAAAESAGLEGESAGESADTRKPEPLYERASADPAFAEAMHAIQNGDHEAGLAALLALQERYPDDPQLGRVIEWASLRAELKPKKQVRPRRWAIRWQRVVGTVLGVAAVGAAGYTIVISAQRYVLPILEERQAARAYTRLVARCDTLLAAENLDEAEPCYTEALARHPEDEAVQAALQDIAARRALAMAYSACVSAYDAGDSQGALARCMEVQRLSPGYRDVQQRILTITQRQRLGEIYTTAVQAREAGQLEEALAGFEQLASLDTTYRAQEVKTARIELYLELGRQIISSNNAELDQLLVANDYFAKALQLSPTHPEAQLERRLASLFSEGVARYQEGQWEEAVIRLRGVYDTRPTYFQQTLLAMLYDAYIKSGDQYRGIGDIGSAYERYYRASQLPVADTALSQLRLAEVMPLITPTPTPTITPTPTATPMATVRPSGGGVARPQPTAIPTPRPLGAYANQIIYRSLQPEQPGYYVREATGANPRYLGPTGSGLDQQYKALLDRYAYSPDGRYRLYVGSTGENRTAIFVELPPEERTPERSAIQLTNLNGLSWDPAWSPDGGRIVFVSNDTGTDDIWIVNADGSGLTNLTAGVSAWDKRPSWSPDGTRIVFWSNREGPMQLYVMNADGRNVRNVSQTSWDETDPVWVR